MRKKCATTMDQTDRMSPMGSCPRTLVVSWHWPPSNRASACVLANLFTEAPPGVFKTITRGLGDVPLHDSCPTPGAVPARFVRWPIDEHTAPRWLVARACRRAVRDYQNSALDLHKSWPIERVAAVYPHRLSLLAGWRIARLLRVPLICYMHDLLAETLTFPSRARRLFWQRMDHRILKDAWMILVPTREFAEHYARRGLDRCWTLPHCVPTCECPDSGTSSNAASFKLVYTGHVYEPHAGAMTALIRATANQPGVEVSYLCPPSELGGLLGRVGARWTSRQDAIRTLRDSDAAVVVLDEDSPCRAEVMGCFPSKIVDYLSAGRPILAIVPKNSFVDRFITESGCGVVVRSKSESSIRRGIETLRDEATIQRMRASCAATARRLSAETWMSRLCARLEIGPGTFPEPDTLEALNVPATVATLEPESARESATQESCCVDVWPDCDPNGERDAPSSIPMIAAG